MNRTKARRIAIAALFAVNLAAGAWRYLHLDQPGGALLWDLRAAVDVVAGCDPQRFADADAPAACRRMVPFLPAAFPLLRWLHEQNWTSITWVWFGVVVPCLIAAFAREAFAAAAPAAAAALLLSLVALKGTSLGIASGQASIVATLLLYAFTLLNDRREVWLRGLGFVCLALASTKPNLALPFFVYLLLSRDLRGLAAAALLTIALQVGFSFAYLGPAGYLRLLVDTPAILDAAPMNSPAWMGASGRVDLAPLLGTLGIDGMMKFALEGSLGLAALTALALRAPRMERRLLLLDVNLVFFALLYHRDYDVPLLALLALPLLWKQRARFGVAACIVAAPAVLPLQAIQAAGISWMPAASVLWNLLGSSMVVAVLGTGAWLTRCCLREPAPDLTSASASDT